MREEEAGNTPEKGVPFSRSADTTTHLHNGLHHADGRGERVRERGPDWRGRGGNKVTGQGKRGREMKNGSEKI